MRFTSASIRLNAAGVSPGKPVITVVRSVTPGTAARRRSAASRVAFTADPRAIAWRIFGSVCWSGTSTYFTACGEVFSQSRKPSVISLG